MFNRLLFTVLLLVPLLSCADDKLDTLEKQASYAIGADIGIKIQDSKVTFDAQALSQGVKDALNGTQLRLPREQLDKVRDEYMKQAQAKILEEKNAIAAANLEAGNRFLKANSNKEGIVTTESGLQYIILRAGTGAMPTENDTVVTHYRGTLIDGREFDSSYKRNQASTFPVKGVIKGWTEALQLMKVGAKWKLFIPANIAYGASKRSELIQANSTLIFELELLDIKK